MIIKSVLLCTFFMFSSSLIAMRNVGLFLSLPTPSFTGDDLAQKNTDKYEKTTINFLLNWLPFTYSLGSPLVYCLAYYVTKRCKSDLPYFEDAMSLDDLREKETFDEECLTMFSATLEKLAVDESEIKYLEEPSLNNSAHSCICIGQSGVMYYGEKFKEMSLKAKQFAFAHELIRFKENYFYKKVCFTGISALSTVSALFIYLLSSSKILKMVEK